MKISIGGPVAQYFPDPAGNLFALYFLGTGYPGGLPLKDWSGNGRDATQVGSGIGAQYLSSGPGAYVDLPFTGNALAAAGDQATIVALARAPGTSSSLIVTGFEPASGNASLSLALPSTHEARPFTISDAGVNAGSTAVLSNRVLSLASLVPGSGGTTGTFALAFSGGGGSGAAGQFVVAGGVVTSYSITNPGTGYTSAPTVSFAASSGLTGASATVVISDRGTSFAAYATTHGLTGHAIHRKRAGGERISSAATFAALSGIGGTRNLRIGFGHGGASSSFPNGADIALVAIYQGILTDGHVETCLDDALAFRAGEGLA